MLNPIGFSPDDRKKNAQFCVKGSSKLYKEGCNNSSTNPAEVC